MTQGYLENDHGMLSSPRATIQYYDDWFARDWRQFYRTVQVPPRPAQLALPASATVDDLVHSWPDSVHGMVLGENHTEIASVTFLLEQMPALYDRGFRTLYIEGSHASGAPMLYLSPGSVTPRSTVVRRARDCRMRVRGLDDDYLTLHRDRHTLKPAIDLSIRLEEMNYFAVRQIQAYQSVDGGKWLAWVGTNHMNTTEGVPGIAELMGGIGVRIKNARAGQPTVVRVPGSRDSLPGGALPDVEIELDVTHVAARLPEGPGNS